MTYKLLPSEVLDRATTFDLFIADTYQRWMLYSEAKSKGQAAPVNSKKYSTQELQAMIDRVRTEESGND